MKHLERTQGVSRRDFIKMGGIVAGLYLLRRWGISVPGKMPERGASLFEPGWLERRNPNRPEFISGEGQDGHREYLKFMATHDPFIITVLMEAYADLIKPHAKRPSIAETFEKHVWYADKHLGPLGGSKTDSVHLAFFTMASVYNDLFTPDEIAAHFYVNVPASEENRTNVFWIKDYYPHMPQVFPDDNGTEFGVDKVVHFTNFAFLVHEYWYAKQHGLEEAKRIPNAAGVVARTGKGDKKDALRLSWLAQNVLEYNETIAWLYNMWDKGVVIWPPSVGFLDPDIQGDFRANKLGRIFGALMARKNISKSYCEKTINRLRDPGKLLAEMG